MRGDPPAAGATTDTTRDGALIWRLAVKRVNPIVCLNDGPSEAPLYCVHPATGDVRGLRDLAALVSFFRFHGIQVPKDKMIAEFGASIEGMARYYVDLLVARQPDGPIVLAGWSAGAIIALEMAQQLQARGRAVPLLIALDGAPCNTGAGLKPWHPLYLLKLLRNVPRWVRDDRHQDWSFRGIAKRLDAKLAFRFGGGVPRLSNTGARLSNTGTVDADSMQRLVDAGGWLPGQKAFIRAMFDAMLDYRPKSYAGRVVVYETTTQPLFRLRQIGAAWKKLAKDVEVVPIPGNHSDVIAQPSIGRISEDLLGRCR